MLEISSSNEGSFFMSDDKTAIDVEDIKEIVKNETIFWKATGGRMKGRMVVKILYESVNERSVTWKEMVRYWNALRVEKGYRWIRNGGVHVINVERLDEEYLSERYAREGRQTGLAPLESPRGIKLSKPSHEQSEGEIKVRN